MKVFCAICRGVGFVKIWKNLEKIGRPWKQSPTNSFFNPLNIKIPYPLKQYTINPAIKTIIPATNGHANAATPAPAAANIAATTTYTTK